MLTQKEITQIQKSLGGAELYSTLFDALSDSGRVKIFKLLAERNDICVTDVAKITGTSIPAASRQLKILEMAGLVERIRSGQTICYKIKKDNNFVKLILKVFN